MGGGAVAADLRPIPPHPSRGGSSSEADRRAARRSVLCASLAAGARASRLLSPQGGRGSASRVQPIPVRSGAGYCGQLRNRQLMSPAEITATSVNGGTNLDGEPQAGMQQGRIHCQRHARRMIGSQQRQRDQRRERCDHCDGWTAAQEHGKHGANRRTERGADDDGERLGNRDIRQIDQDRHRRRKGRDQINPAMPNIQPGKSAEQNGHPQGARDSGTLRCAQWEMTQFSILFRPAKLPTHGQRGARVPRHGRRRPATHDFPLLHAAKSWMAGLRRP